MTATHCEFRTVALRLAALGYRVFPVKPLSKEPAIVRWQDAATTDAVTIESWAKTHPTGNVGIVGGDGLLILDADNPAAENALIGALETALQSILPDWHAFLDWQGSTSGEPPEGPFVLTQGEGLHAYLRVLPGSTLAAVGTRTAWCGVKGLDTRAKGGFVVAPGSVVMAKHDGAKWRAQPGKPKERAAWEALPGQPELRPYRGDLPPFKSIPALGTLALGGLGSQQTAPNSPGVVGSAPTAKTAPLVATLPRPAELSVVADALDAIARKWAAAGTCSNGEWQAVVMGVAGAHRLGKLVGKDGTPATSDAVHGMLMDFSQKAPGFDDAALGRIDNMLDSARGDRGLGSVFATAKAMGWMDPRSTVPPAVVSPHMALGCPLTLKDHAEMSEHASGSVRKAALALARTCTVRDFIRYDHALGGFRAYDAAAGAWVPFDVLGGILDPALIPLHDTAVREAKAHLHGHAAELETTLREDEARAQNGTDEASFLALVLARYAAAAAPGPAAAGQAATLVANIRRDRATTLQAASTGKSIARLRTLTGIACAKFDLPDDRLRVWKDLPNAAPELSHVFDGKPVAHASRAVAAAADGTLLTDGSMVAHDPRHMCVRRVEWTLASAAGGTPLASALMAGLLRGVPQGEKQAAAKYILGMLGTTLRGGPVGRVLFVAGAAGSGKSVFLDLVREMFGSEATSFSAEQVCGPNPDTAALLRLCRHRMLVCHEFQSKNANDFATFKAMATGEAFTAGKGRAAYAAEGGEMRFCGMMAVASNALPHAGSDDLAAVVRRAVVVQVPATAAVANPDPEFKSRVLAETAAFARMCLLASRHWQQGGLPAALKPNLAAFAGTVALDLQEWLKAEEANGTVEFGSDLFTPAGTGCQRFNAYRQSQGGSPPPVGPQRFAVEMAAVGYPRAVDVFRVGPSGRRGDGTGRSVAPTSNFTGLHLRPQPLPGRAPLALVSAVV
jgi:hypothetical protein